VRNTLFSTITIVFLILIVVGGSISQAQTVRLTQTFYSWAGQQWYEWLQDRAEAFQGKHPEIEVEIMTVAGHEYQEKLLAMAAAGVSPDIIDTPISYAMAFLVNGLFADLDTFIEKDADVVISDFLPLAIDGYVWNGIRWMFPIDVWPMATAYNATLFAESGLPVPNDLAREGWNWHEVLDFARKLTQDTTGDGEVNQYGICSPWVNFYRNTYWMYQAGAELFNRTVDPSEAYLDTPEVEEAMEWFVSWYERGYAEYGVEHFIEGSAGMNFDGGVSTVFHWRDAGRPFDLQYYFLPHGPVKGGTDVSVNGFQISSLSEYQKEAWEWVKFLATNEESVTKYVNYTNRIPPLLSVTREYANLIPGVPVTFPIWTEVVMDPDNQPRPLVRGGARIRSAWDPEIEAAIRGEQSVREAIVRANRQINLILKEER